MVAWLRVKVPWDLGKFRRSFTIPLCSTSTSGRWRQRRSSILSPWLRQETEPPLAGTPPLDKYAGKAMKKPFFWSQMPQKKWESVESGKHLVIFQEASERKWNSHPILFPFCHTYTKKKKAFTTIRLGPRCCSVQSLFCHLRILSKKKSCPVRLINWRMQWKSPWLTFPASQRLVVPQGSRQCLYPELLERFQGFSCTILHWAWWSCLVDMTFWECQVSKTMSASFFPLDLHHIMSVNKTHPWFIYCHTPSCICFVILQASCCITIC